MSIRKNTLFTVPLFCIAAGFACFYLIVYGVGRFAIVTLPDGTRASDESRVLLLYGLVLAASLAIGGPLLFRRLTKKEIAVSATIMVAFRLVTLLLEALLSPTGSLAVTFSYLAMPGEWYTFIPLLLYRLTGSFLLSAVLGAFTPYIFILFGKKRLE